MYTLETALFFLELGISVFPCHPVSKEPRGPWGRWRSELPTYAHLAAWFTGPNNIAVVTGHNGLVVLDFDNDGAYDLWIEFARSTWPAGADLTYRVRTARGWHVYLSVGEAVRAQRLAGLGDLKANGGYVLGAGSIHPSGVIYTAVPGPIVRAATLAEVLPAALIAPPILSTVSPQPQPRPVGIGGGDLLERAKAAIRIEEHFPNARVSGNGWLIDWCPFHPDKRQGGTQSFWINPARQLCGCYSGCNGGRAMDGVNFYAMLRGIGVREAIRELGTQYGGQL